MLAVIGIIVIVFAWRFLILTAAVVFQRAGLSPAAATFEARSALTGSGYTTSESEVVVADPAARDAASMLFLMGFIGPVTLLGLLGFGFLIPASTDLQERVAALFGLLTLFFILERTGINVRLLEGPARRAAGVFGSRPEAPWRVVGDHAVLALPVSASTLVAGTALGEHPFTDSTVTVLGIQRLGGGTSEYIAWPRPEEVIRSGDELVLYGPMAKLAVMRGGTS
jgi:hypothetical protein